MKNGSTTESVWRTLSDRLRRFIRSRVPCDADADDILQSVFLRIHEKLNELNRLSRLESWVFQIARNAMVDHFRSSKTTIPADELSIEGHDSAIDGNLNSRVGGWLRGMIALLPDEQQRAVTMYELQGLSQNTIAEREGISLSGAKSRIQRGRKNLRKMLLDCCEFQRDQRGNFLAVKPIDAADCACREDCSVARYPPRIGLG